MIRKIGSCGSDNGQFINPEGVTFDSKNVLYVVDCGNNKVQIFDVNGNYVFHYGGYGLGNGQLSIPVGITTHNDKVFVTEQGNQRISVFHTNGQFSHIIGKGRLDCPFDVTVNTNNQLLVADYHHHCIYTFTLDGNYVSKFASQGSDKGFLLKPIGLTTDMYGFILVVESGNSRVSIFSKDCNFMYCFGSNGSDDGKFKNPRGIALSPNGDIYISDAANKRVQIFSTC